MADLAILLGQVGDASTEATLYTVPASTNTTVSSIVVCNRGAADTTFRIAVNDGGGATANQDYLFFDVPLPGNDTFIATIGGTLEATDTIKVLSGNANVSFNAFGVESA